MSTAAEHEQDLERRGAHRRLTPALEALGFPTAPALPGPDATTPGERDEVPGEAGE